MADPYDSRDLFGGAMRGDRIDRNRTLATYGSENNWTTMTVNGQCYWVWSGPVICPFELAQWALRDHKREG